MKKNINFTDRIIRFILGIAAAFLFFTHVISGPVAVVLLTVGLVLAGTSIINFCPIYYVLGWSTKKKEETKS